MSREFEEFSKKADELFAEGFKRLKEAITYIEEGSFEKAELRLEDAANTFKKLLEVINEFIHESGKKPLRTTMKSFGQVTSSFIEYFLEVTEDLQRAIKKL